jgi:hypothetical protein
MKAAVEHLEQGHETELKYCGNKRLLPYPYGGSDPAEPRNAAHEAAAMAASSAIYRPKAPGEADEGTEAVTLDTRPDFRPAGVSGDLNQLVRHSD